MAKWSELTDFSEYDGTLPCVLCKADSSKTLVGNHWKCSACAHIFNKDGSELKVDCYCETCAKAKAAKEPKGMNLEDLIEKMGKLKKKLPKVPKTKRDVKKKKKN